MHSAISVKLIFNLGGFPEGKTNSKLRLFLLLKIFPGGKGNKTEIKRNKQDKTSPN
jgi:hypothetical protein